MLDNTFGQRVVALRESLHLTRRQFATKLKCSMAHIINVEKDRAALGDKRVKLAIEVFGLSETFFDGAEVPKRAFDDWDIAIGGNIKKLRKAKELTQTQLAEEIDISGASVISAAETGRGPLSRVKLLKLAEYFGVNLTELLRINSNTPRRNRKQEKLVEDFVMVIRAKKKPAVYDLLIRLLSEARSELSLNKS